MPQRIKFRGRTGKPGAAGGKYPNRYPNPSHVRSLRELKKIAQRPLHRAKKELEFALEPHPMFAGAYQRALFENLPFEVVEGDVDLFAGVKLLFTPGIQSVAVSIASGLAIITRFCCTLENFYPQKSQAWVTDRTPEVIPLGINMDMLQAYESAVRIKKMADIIIPIYDPVMTKKAKIP